MVLNEETATVTTTVLIVGDSDGRNHTLIKGNIRGWLASNRIPALWSPTNRGWWIRTQRIADLVALAEHHGLIVKAAPR
jgi:hypothetical protein